MANGSSNGVVKSREKAAERLGITVEGLDELAAVDGFPGHEGHYPIAEIQAWMAASVVDSDLGIRWVTIRIPLFDPNYEPERYRHICNESGRADFHLSSTDATRAAFRQVHAGMMRAGEHLWPTYKVNPVDVMSDVYIRLIEMIAEAADLAPVNA